MKTPLPDVEVRFWYTLRGRTPVQLDGTSQRALKEVQSQYSLPPNLVQRVQDYLEREWKVRFTVEDLLDSFVSEVVSGAGFSTDDANRFYAAAAAVLGVPVKAVPDFNLAGPGRLTDLQVEQLDPALFNQGYLKASQLRTLTANIRITGPELGRCCQGEPST